MRGLAYPDWGARPYPADSYPCLIAAMKIDEEAALKSASLGLGQIMGFNYSHAGYASVYDMVSTFCDSEAAQLGAMASFIKKAGLTRALERQDWSAFALGYDGVGIRARRMFYRKLS